MSRRALFSLGALVVFIPFLFFVFQVPCFVSFASFVFRFLVGANLPGF